MSASQKFWFWVFVLLLTPFACWIVAVKGQEPSVPQEPPPVPGSSLVSRPAPPRALAPSLGPDRILLPEITRLQFDNLKKDVMISAQQVQILQGQLDTARANQQNQVNRFWMEVEKQRTILKAPESEYTFDPEALAFKRSDGPSSSGPTAGTKTPASPSPPAAAKQPAK